MTYSSWPPWTDPGRYLRERFPHATDLKFGPPPIGEGVLVAGLRIHEVPIPLPSERKVLVPDLPRSATLGGAFGLRLAGRYTTGGWRPTRAGGGRRLALRSLGLEPPNDPVWGAILADFVTLARHAQNATDVDRALVEQRLTRLCVVLTWYQQVDISGGGALMSSPVSHIGPDTRLDDLLALVSDEMVAAVGKLMVLAADHLPDPADCVDVEIEPRCGIGQADLLLDGLLLEVKTIQRPSITKDYAYQLIGYLLGLNPPLRADRAGWYFARHGILWDFDAADLLRVAAGEPVDLDVAQSEFRAVGG